MGLQEELKKYKYLRIHLKNGEVKEFNWFDTEFAFDLTRHTLNVWDAETEETLLIVSNENFDYLERGK